MAQPQDCRGFHWWLCLLLAVAAASPAVAQRTARTVPADLSELVAQASTIIRGRVVDAHVEPHPQFPNLMTVVVTLRVDKSFKGEAGPTFTFRQYVWDLRDQREVMGFRKGEELLLLMNAPSRYGLSSPAGQEQGRFRIVRDAQGRATAVNGRGNRGLLSGLAAESAQRGVQLSARTSALVAKHREGPVPLDELEEMITLLVGPQ